MKARQRRVERRADERREGRSTREQMLERFGRDAEERVADRRKPQTPTERDRILKQLGIEDRRRQERRR